MGSTRGWHASVPIARQFTVMLGFAMFCALASSQYSDHLGPWSGFTYWLVGNNGVVMAIALQYGGLALCHLGMRRAQRLAWQRCCALATVAVALCIVPMSPLGGQVLVYVTVALLALTTPVWVGWVSLAACYWAIMLLTGANRWTQYDELVGTFRSRQVTLYLLFVGVMFLLYTRQTMRLDAQNRQLERNVATIESLTLAKERARMASDMHDSIGQQLTAIHCAHEAAAHALTTAGANGADGGADLAAAAGHVAEAERITREAMQQVRQMARALNPYDFGERLDAQSIAALANSFQSTGVTVRPRIEGDVAALGSDAKLLVYRMLQETLTNAVRHAHASRIDLTIAVTGKPGSADVTVRVEDDGPGMTAADLEHGFGLRGVRRRARQAGGTLDIGSSPTLGGTLIELRLPWSGAARDDAEHPRDDNKATDDMPYEERWDSTHDRDGGNR